MGGPLHRFHLLILDLDAPWKPPSEVLTSITARGRWTRATRAEVPTPRRPMFSHQLFETRTTVGRVHIRDQ